jgi:hypothetical protein
MSLVWLCLALLLLYTYDHVIFWIFTDFLEFFHAVLLSETVFCKYMTSLVWLYLTLLLLYTCDHMTFSGFLQIFWTFFMLYSFLKQCFANILC